jgi:myosin-5
MPGSDKYQFGSTKIFFRAGSLAEMDAARSAKAENILSLVRRNMLRYRAVKYLREARRAVITVQRWWRHILAWKAILKLRGEALALAKQRALQLRRIRNGDATPTSELAQPWSGSPD